MWEILATSYMAQVGAIIAGFVALIYGADWLVDGASGIAKRFGVSDLVIGLTVVAFGTSMPEFIVSFLAALQHNTEIAITNILGSNSINTLVILGCTALIYPIASHASCRKFDIPMSLAAGVLILLITSFGTAPIRRWGGVLLLLFFGGFMAHSLMTSKQNQSNCTNTTSRPMSLCKALILIGIGLAGLVFGGECVVRGATCMAHSLGVNDAIIGLTIVALGTSLPELATSCIAASKRNCDLALGNVIGSNIFNIFFILGISALLHPLPPYEGLWIDAALVVLSALLIFLFVVLQKRHEIQRWHGAVLLLIYAVYLTYRIMNL